MWAGSNWSFTVNETEVVRQVLSRKTEADELDLERTKCQCLENQVSELKNRVHVQEIIKGSDWHKSYVKKPIEECARQQQLTWKKMVREIKGCVHAEGYDPCSIELKSQSGLSEVFDLTGNKVSGTHTTFTSNYEKAWSLYVKDKFAVYFEAYHELSMLFNLPSSSQVRTLATSLNSQFKIKNCPNNITRVQQSIKLNIT